MELNNKHYIPCIRWKTGEYQAIFKVDNENKKHLIPLIEVPEIGWDFGKGRATRTLEEHLELFTKRVIKKWGVKPCIIDITYILCRGITEEENKSIRFIFNKLRENHCYAIPTIHLDSNAKYLNEIMNIIKIDKRGLCLRLSLEQASKDSLKNDIDILVSKLKTQLNEVSLIIDLGAPNYIPLEGFIKLIEKIIYRLPYLNDWQTFSILSTSVPKTMSGIKKGITILDRYEWLLYKELIKAFKIKKIRLPNFGDYGIYHPGVILPLDMRFINPSAYIKYTINNKWYIVKGKAIREEDGYNLEQFRELCRNIISSKYYCGYDFSIGDRHIKDCAIGKTDSPGYLNTWIQMGMNHHFHKVISDIANYYAS